MNILKKLRKEKGMTLEALSAKTDLSVTTINNAEKGHSDLKSKSLIKLITACGYRLVLVPETMVEMSAEGPASIKLGFVELV